MFDIPYDLRLRLRNTLLDCDPFNSDQELQAIFVDTRLSQWKAGLPEATSDAERVQLTIEYLLKRSNVDGKNGLVLLLHVLHDQTSPKSACHYNLSQLVIELEQHAPAPDTPEWNTALNRYHERVKALYSTIRVLGKHEPVSLEGIYTDVYLLEQPTASRYIDLNDLPLEKKGKRLDGIELVKQLDTQILVILGKPGAGKTTFLKHITLQAAAGQLDDRVPIFVALREWTDDDDLLDILAEPFTGCGLADPRPYVEYLLQTGRALLLFDALDEMSEQARSAFIKTLERFSRRYLDCHILLTCRTAATPYQFERAKTVEVADFTDDQMRAFTANWFGEDTTKAEKFRGQIEQDERLHNLGRTPLLLGMLCLIFDERGDFPQKRADLYRQALGTLLVQWDESRNIERDAMRRAEVYHELSLDRKYQMFAHIAHATFEQGEILIPKERLECLITDYLLTIPNTPATIDTTTILKAIEAQHSILVEHARGVYAFLHPTFQEYYAACYVVAQVENGDAEAISHLLTHLQEYHWREVILLTVSMLSNADAFFEVFQVVLDNLVKDDNKLVEFLAWAARKASSINVFRKPAAIRAYYVWFPLNHARNIAIGLDLTYARIFANARDCVRDFVLALDFAFACDLTAALNYDIALDNISQLDLARALDLALVCTYASTHALDTALELIRARSYALSLDYTRSRAFSLSLSLSEKMKLMELHTALSNLIIPDLNAPRSTWWFFTKQLQSLMIEHRDIGHDWEFTREQVKTLARYFTIAGFLVECLDVANVSDRKTIEDRLLLPPKREAE